MGLTIVSPILNFCTYYSIVSGVCQDFFTHEPRKLCSPTNYVKHFYTLVLTPLRTRQGFVASFTSPIWHRYCSTFCAVCQEVSQIFHTIYNPGKAARIYNVVYSIYFLYFLEVARPLVSWATPSWHYRVYHISGFLSIGILYNDLLKKLVNIPSWQNGAATQSWPRGRNFTITSRKMN